MIQLGVFLLVFSAGLTGRIVAHEESGEWSCETGSDIRVEADFYPGMITLDGIVDDWNDVAGSEFSLLPALDPDADKEYRAGKLTVKALHDGRDAFFMLQAEGDYSYYNRNGFMCPSVALMFQIGNDATYHNMGGCKEGTSTCNNKTCKGYDVDIMHFSIGSAVPGRIYGSNLLDNSEGYGNDRFGHLVDLYAWNPHCRYYDGKGPSGNVSGAQNDWKGVWWHSLLSARPGYVESDAPYSTNGQKGSYNFEFSRPLRTTDRSQQDAQFSIGSSSKMAVAFWYPVDGKPWSPAEHYSINCDWIAVDFGYGRRGSGHSSSDNAKDVTSGFAVFLSIVAIGLSSFVAYRVARQKDVPFSQIQMNNL